MNADTKKELVDNLLTTFQILEDPNTISALNSDEALGTTKGIIARLVMMISNTKIEE